MTQFEKTQRNLRASLDINDQLTWGELVRFVELAAETGEAQPGAPVGLLRDPQDAARVTAMYVYLGVEPDDAGHRAHAAGSPAAGDSTESPAAGNHGLDGAGHDGEGHDGEGNDGAGNDGERTGGATACRALEPVVAA